MKATFTQFLEENKNCSGLDSNPDARAIFDFLNLDENIIKMVDYSDQGKPALAACVLELEAMYDAIPQPTLDLNDAFTRTAVGRMVKCILKPFGYRVVKQKDFPKQRKGKYFVSASCYEMDETDPQISLRIAKRIEEI